MTPNMTNDEVREVLETNTVTTGDVCNILDITRQSLHRINTMAELVPFRMANHISLYSLCDVEAYIKKYKDCEDYKKCMARLTAFRSELEKNKSSYY